MLDLEACLGNTTVCSLIGKFKDACKRCQYQKISFYAFYALFRKIRFVLCISTGKKSGKAGQLALFANVQL